MKSCLNCGQSFDDGNKFCNHCGQKTNIKVVSFWNIIRDFFSNLFNIDNKIWQTLKDIWIPANLTKAYIEGRRVKYYNPLRIFIIVLFTFFGFLLLYNKSEISKVDELKKTMEKNFWMDELIVKFDSLTHNSNIDPDTLIRLKIDLLDYKEKLNEENNKVLSDTIKIDSTLTPAEILEIKDSLLTLQMFNPEDFNDDEGVVKFQLGESEDDDLFIDDIKTSDFFSLSSEEVVEKYGKGDWMRTLFITQAQKIMNNPGDSLKFLLGNGTWAMIITILLMSLFFKLIYIRHNILYAEHFIFQVYGHTRILLLSIVGIILNLFFDLGNVWLYPIILIGLYYMYKGMRKFYAQSRIKTIGKLMLSLSAYLLIIWFCITLILVVSLTVF